MFLGGVEFELGQGVWRVVHDSFPEISQKFALSSGHLGKYFLASPPYLSCCPGTFPPNYLWIIRLWLFFWEISNFHILSCAHLYSSFIYTNQHNAVHLTIFSLYRNKTLEIISKSAENKKLARCIQILALRIFEKTLLIIDPMGRKSVFPILSNLDVTIVW